MLEWSFTIKKTYKPTPKVATMNATPSTTRLYVETQAPYQVQTPADPLEALIPPKPPYANCHINRALIGHNARSSHEIRHNNEWPPLLSTAIQWLLSMINLQKNCFLTPYKTMTRWYWQICNNEQLLQLMLRLAQNNGSAENTCQLFMWISNHGLQTSQHKG